MHGLLFLSPSPCNRPSSFCPERCDPRPFTNGGHAQPGKALPRDAESALRLCLKLRQTARDDSLLCASPTTKGKEGTEGAALKGTETGETGPGKETRTVITL